MLYCIVCLLLKNIRIYYRVHRKNRESIVDVKFILFRVNLKFALSNDVLVFVENHERACRCVLFGYKRINANHIHRKSSTSREPYLLLFVKMI